MQLRLGQTFQIQPQSAAQNLNWGLSKQHKDIAEALFFLHVIYFTFI